MKFKYLFVNTFNKIWSKVNLECHFSVNNRTVKGHLITKKGIMLGSVKEGKERVENNIMAGHDARKR